MRILHLTKNTDNKRKKKKRKMMMRKEMTMVMSN